MPNIALYDFMNDRIVRGSDVPGLLVISFNDLANPTVMNRLPADAMYVPKGTAVVAQDGAVRGGEFVPYVGTKENLALIRNSIISVNTAMQGTGQAVDVMSALSDSERQRVQALLQAPAYSNFIINLIIKSNERGGAGEVDRSRGLQETLGRIRQKLMRSNTINEEQAINAVTGALVRATTSSYNIQEMSVVVGDDGRRIVRFAFPQSQAPYREKGFTQAQLQDALRSTFQAQPVRASEVSERERASVSVRPVRLTGAEYSNLFNTNESFQSYIAQLNRLAQVQRPAIDTSQVLHTQAQPEFAEDNVDEEDFEDENIDDY